MDSDFDSIRQMWARLNVTNVWQGEGITNCLNPILGHRLEKLVAERDAARSYCQKVYRWTIDLTDSIKSVLRYDIDGIMTNHPERVAAIVHHDPELSRWYRLATIHDDPFARYRPGKGSSWPANRRTQATAPKGASERVRTFFRDLKDSFFHFLHELVHSLF